MTAKEKLWELGYEDVVVFENPSFDSALIGVSEDNRAVYDYQKMVVWLAVDYHISMEEAIDFIEYNTIRSLPYVGKSAPIVVHRIP